MFVCTKSDDSCGNIKNNQLVSSLGLELFIKIKPTELNQNIQKIEMGQEPILSIDDFPEKEIVVNIPKQISLMEPAEDIALSKYLSRPLPVASFTWLVSDAFGATLNALFPLQVWASDLSVKRKLSNYRFLTGTLKIQISVVGTALSTGRVLVTNCPLLGTDPRNRNLLSPYGMSVERTQPHPYVQYQMDPLIIEPAFSKEYEMEMSTITQTGFWQISELIAGASGHVVTFNVASVLRQLAQNSIAPKVTFKVYACVEGAKLYVPTVTAYSETGSFLSSANLNKLSDSITKMQLGPTATAAATALKVGATAAKAMGYSNPNVAPVSMAPLVTNNNFSATRGSQTYQRIGADITSSTPISGLKQGLGESPGPLTDITSRYGVHTFTTWDQSQTSGTVLTTLTVHPFSFMSIPSTYYGTSGNGSVVTPSYFVADAFSYWGGDMEFEIHVIANPVIRGMLQITFEPTTANPSGLYTAQTKVVNIEGTTTISFCAPWSNRNLLEPSGSLGSLYISVFAPLTCSVASAGTTVDIHILSCVPNMVVAVPNSSTNVFTLASDISAQTDCPTHNNFSYRSDLVAGENIVTLRDLLKRNSKVGQAIYTFTDSVTPNVPTNVEISLPRFPPYKKNAATYTPYTTYNTSLLSYFSAAFLGCTGSVDHTFKVMVNGAASVKDQIGTVMVSSQCGSAVGTAIVSEPDVNWSNAYSVSDIKQNHLIEVEVPLVNETGVNRCVTQTNVSLVGSTVKLTFPYVTQNAGSISFHITHYTKAADDFQLYGFLNIPIFWV